MMTGEWLYCDLVMKGGITSGIVYPNAALELARRYRFKNIGGTSAGAIAAAACAAAALGQRRRESAAATGKNAGFVGLRVVADELTGPGFIYSLFQPAGHGRAAYDALVGLSASPPGLKRVTILLSSICRIAPLEIAGVAASLFALAYVIAGMRGIEAAALPVVACAFVIGAAAAAMRVARIVRRNLMGLCSGLMQPSSKRPGLSDWLHQVLQDLSGAADDPLTFADLWGAPRYEDEPDGDATIRLEMITTSVSHHEPRSLPMMSGSFWFREDEFLELFPQPVVNWMKALDPAPVDLDGKRYFRLPAGEKMPVIVATRMSLSFPLLLSAVPLYEPAGGAGAVNNPDAGQAPSERQQHSLLASAEALAVHGDQAVQPASLRKCWFSDGGISSNFPIHLFDAALPRWPTFAINLTYPTDGHAGIDDVYLPKSNNHGWHRQYNSFEARFAFKELAGFVAAIVGTMQNWRDLLQARAPGQRDRIVRVPLGPLEGGMNLNMSAAVLKSIAKKGTRAGDMLREDFDFDNHWWVRWRNSASGLERFTGEIARAAGPGVYTQAQSALANALSPTGTSKSYKFTRRQQSLGAQYLQDLVEQGKSWPTGTSSLTYKAPQPLPQLRMTPTY